MRSLAAKLTLAFLLVGLIGAGIVAVMVRHRTQNEFGRLILDQNQRFLINGLTRYFQEHGSWEGVESIFRPGPDAPPSVHDFLSNWETRRNLFIITDSDGVIVFGGIEDLGKQISPTRQRGGIPLLSDGENIGWLFFRPALTRWRPGTLEGDFLFNINNAIVLSAIVAVVVALVLGGVLAYTMTRSLRELKAATIELAEGKLGYQVEVRSKDEIGDLATSFNRMSLELAHSNELRQRMTADIAHDLRTPMSVIMGYTEALNDGKLQATPEMYAVMHSESLLLSRLIDDLKTIALVDAGELPLMMQKVSPIVLLKRTADAHRVQAEREQISISISASSEMPDIEVDVERMVQVLGNLMSNAIRYTPQGGEIFLSADEGESGVRLEVADTGIGIPEEDLPYIFERAYRGDQAREQSQGETGLGLAIAKSLVEAQGGKIDVESELGKGTKFTILITETTANLV
jgi:two-component system sensor histidine kinase BaeS